LMMLFSYTLGWTPIQGKSPHGVDGISWEYAILPVVTMTVMSLTYKARIMRSSMIESLGQDFIDTARSKGLSSNRVLWRHGLPNALLPMVTVSGYSLGFILAGSVIVEKVFSWPGMGLLFINSIEAQDNFVVLGIVIFITATILIVNILTDIVYGIVDPRLRARFRPVRSGA
jgi:peptide/nickel transport system permease protein